MKVSQTSALYFGNLEVLQLCNRAQIWLTDASFGGQQPANELDGVIPQPQPSGVQNMACPIMARGRSFFPKDTGAGRMAHMESELRLNSRLGTLLIEHRDALLAISARHHAKNVRIFGSVVRGEDSPSSDVDFLVEFDEDAHPLDILALGCDLEEELGVRVDVCTPQGLRPFVRDEVVAEAVSL